MESQNFDTLIVVKLSTSGHFCWLGKKEMGFGITVVGAEL